MDDTSITFSVNGKTHTVENVDATMSLNSWIRAQPGLTGTKVMCYEGGCGSCVVGLETTPGQIKAVNSCLVLLASVDGSSVITVEGIGSSREGFHQIQSRLADFDGSQCGYCSSGFVMNMYSLLSDDPSPTQKKIEDSFDGNICRCTGYRPILDAMKSFASDADPKLLKKCGDIEDLGKDFCYLECSRKKSGPTKKKAMQLVNEDGEIAWIRPANFTDLVAVLKAQPTAQMVCGNTASGIYYRSGQPSALVDVAQIPELTTVKLSGGSLICGASVTLNQLIAALLASSSPMFSAIANHLKKVASLPIRNLASWAGNLMVKYRHREFPSDVFVLLEAAGATITLYDVTNNASLTCSASELMAINMDQKVIKSFTLQENTSTEIFSSYKTMPRPQNAHAYVSAAFHVETSKDKKTISGKTRLVFGGISSEFVHATNTEAFLSGKVINNSSTLTGALQLLSDEVKPVQLNAADASVKYKHDVSLGLFYKFYLSLCDPSVLGPGIESAITPLSRPVSKATQTFTDDPSTFPVSQNIPKLAAKLQTSGEAIYISDNPISKDELHCAFVVSNTANADIDEVYDSMAQLMPGFVAIIKGSTIPSEIKNTHLFPFDTTRPILATDHVDFVGQPVALVVAETSSQVYAIANAVTVTYKNEKPLLVSTEDAIQAGSFYDNPYPDFSIGNPDQAMAAAKNKVSGEIVLGGQYHFYMETQIARAKTTEEGGFLLDCATQTQQWVQDAIAYAFNTSANRVEVNTKRVGGAYGGKSTNSLLTSCGAALASYCTQRPVCLHADLKTCMTTYGTRTPFTLKYTLGFDDDGIVSAMDYKVYSNSGCSSFDGELNDPTSIPLFGDSAYFCPNRKWKSYVCKTNTPSSTWCRAPTSLQFTAFADQVLEHVASFLEKDPIEVKRANLYKKGQTDLGGKTLEYCQIGEIYDKLLQTSDVSGRQSEISAFNNANKWKKKGLAVSPIKFNIDYAPGKYTVLISICAGDGTVIVSHGGIESGQGINTKVAQVAAYQLGVPIDLIMVQRTSNITSSNSQVTGGSITSEVNCQTVLECCKILNSRIDPIRSEMPPDTTWKDLIAQCFVKNVDLACSYMWVPPPTGQYNSYGVTVSEVELDVLIGEYQITKVDTVFDCGISLSPGIDIGQVEGAFVMGLGYWLTENLVVDETTGQILTDGTWEYKPPSSKDIPIEWNIELLKNAPNPLGILRSKASGEPPMCMSISVLDALKRAVEASKRDRMQKDFFQMPTPATVEQIYLTANIDALKEFTFN